MQRDLFEKGMTMRWRLGVVTAICVAVLAAGEVGQRQALMADVAGGQENTTRAAFLKLIDRPKVALGAELKEAKPPGEGLVEYRLDYLAAEGRRVPGIIIKAEGAKGKLPVLIALHGTGGSKEGERALLSKAAQMGFLGVAIDGPYHGERAKTKTHPNDYDVAILKAYQSPEPHEHPFFYDTVWDIMRLIDYLETRGDVDGSRIGMYGVSKGGIETYLTAAVDSRVAAAVPCIGVESFRWALDHNTWKSRIETVQAAFDSAAKEAGVATPDAAFVAKFYDKVAPGIADKFDGPAMVPLIAPRYLLTINGELDPRTPGPGLKECTDAAETAYKAAGASNHFEHRIEAGTAHKVTPESEAYALEWLGKCLRATAVAP